MIWFTKEHKIWRLNERPDWDDAKRASQTLRYQCPSGASQEKLAIANPYPELKDSFGMKRSCQAAIMDQTRRFYYKRCSRQDPINDVCCETCLLYSLISCTNRSAIEPIYHASAECQRLKNCQDFTKNPCFNDGKCVNTSPVSNQSQTDVIAGFECKCKNGFKGMLCEIF